MKSRAPLRVVSGCLLVLSSLSCDLSTGPNRQPPLDLALDFCSDATPVFFAYQNRGGDWVRVTPDAGGTFRFTADFRVALIYVLQNGSDYRTEIIGALNTELAAISGAACLEENGTKQLNGTVAGLAGTQRALVTMAFAGVYLQSPQTSFTLLGLPDRTLDLVASRVIFTGTTTQSSDRVIVRRNQNLVTGTTMPVLDFGSAEAVTTTTNIVTVSGLAPGDETSLYNNFFSAQGTSHLLFFSQLSANGDVSVPSLPTSQSIAGDYHDMFLTANAPDGSTFRGVDVYFRSPSSKTLILGNQQSAQPTFETVSVTPYLRHRVLMAMGTEYTAAANFFLRQQFQQFSVTEVSLTVTLRYYDILGTWDLTFPDLTGVSGWQNAWGLQAGTPVTWTATVYSGRANLLFGAAPDDGEAIFFSGRASSFQALRAMPGMPASRASLIGSRRRLSSPDR